MSESHGVEFLGIVRYSASPSGRILLTHEAVFIARASDDAVRNGAMLIRVFPYA